MQLNKVNYKDLNARQKENYNFHKVASALADYGFNSMRLNDDWQGADFLAIKGDEMIKIQLKSRFTVDLKYLKKDLYIAFIENRVAKIYNHDKAVKILPEKTKETASWKESGSYSWNKTPKYFEPIISEL